MKAKKPAVIVPMYIETNGKVAKLAQLMRDPRTRKEYEMLLKKLNADPEHLGQKLRQVTWAGKSVGDILAELD